MIPKLREDRPGRGGDHESFVDQGYPGVRFIEPIEALPHQHTPDDLFAYVTPAYTARVARLVIAVGSSLARAPSAPVAFAASGTADSPSLTWTAPTFGNVDHYVVAARQVTENFYRARVATGGASMIGSPLALGLDSGTAFFISVAAVDAAGHESLFAYPEYRCDSSGCVVPAAAMDVTAKN
jgi:leucyl aminopeptidase